MTNLWTFGGLSPRELAVRTWRESWNDAVFGQAARLAFYHFLAMFPAMLLLFFLLVNFPGVSAHLRTTLAAALSGILPNEAGALIERMIQELNSTASAGRGIAAAGLGAAWAAINGTWALMTGLNTAYEVKEQRPLWKEIGIAFLLTVAIAVMVVLALCILAYAGRIAGLAGESNGNTSLFILRWLEWPVLIIVLLASFALFYRFGPNLYDREWQWSTPGAVLALVLWLIASWLVRWYFELFHAYHVVYGSIEGIAMLLLWLYFTSAAILIGGEMNSEIEKSVGQRGTPNHQPGRKREGR